MVQLSEELDGMIERERVEGGYATAEDVVRAGIDALHAAREEARTFGDFAPGELADFVEVGMRDVRAGRTAPIEVLVAEKDRLSDDMRRQVAASAERIPVARAS